LFTSTGTAGFDSGFMPVAAGATNFPTYTVQVNNTSPIWAFCRQAGHCGQGMVFAANAVESGPKSFEAFVALAKQLNGTSSTSTSSPYSTPAASDAWRPAAGSSSMAVVLVLSAAVWLL
jgi:hypothetical protein